MQSTMVAACPVSAGNQPHCLPAAYTSLLQNKINQLPPRKPAHCCLSHAQQRDTNQHQQQQHHSHWLSETLHSDARSDPEHHIHGQDVNSNTLPTISRPVGTCSSTKGSGSRACYNSSRQEPGLHGTARRSGLQLHVDPVVTNAGSAASF